jgi:hypothetical protein
MSIHDLSVELLQLILLQCQPEDLASVQRTCRSISVLAQPLLYSDINFKNRFSSPSLPNIQLLTRTLTHRPSLGLQIKHLRLRGPESWPSYLKISDQDLALLARRGTGTGHGSFVSWLEALLSSSREAFLVILLSFLPSLTTLAFEDDPNVQFNMHHSTIGSWMSSPLPENTFRRASLFSHAVTKLSNLKNIELGLQKEGTMLSYNSPIIQTIQSLPGLENFKCSLRRTPAINSSSHFPLPISASFPSSNLTTLSLHDCALSERSTVLLTTRIPNLVELNVDFSRRQLSATERLAGRIPPDSHLWLDCGLLGQYLTSTSNLQSLNHLSLSLSFPAPPAPQAPASGGAFECGRSPLNADPACFFGIKGSISCLQLFPSIKSLSIPVPMLLGWYPEQAQSLSSLLPESLERLCLGDEMSDWALYKWDSKSVDALIREYRRDLGLGNGAKVINGLLQGE